VLRIYLNDFDRPHLWQVDDGDIAHATQWDGVEITVICWTSEDLSKRSSQDEPCCWIECNGMLREVSHGRSGGKHAVIIDAG
jgi:hypothetical protein